MTPDSLRELLDELRGVVRLAEIHPLDSIHARLDDAIAACSQIEICQKEPRAYQSKNTELLYELDATQVDFAEMWTLFRRYGDTK